MNNKLQFYYKKSAIFIVLLLLLPIKQSAAAYNIGPDDVLRISVYDHDDLKTETRVSADGRITFPLIGEVIASGKTPQELEKEIATDLVKGAIIQDAQVSVIMVDHVSQQVSVLGHVNKPGRYSLDSDSSIVDLIAMAGGVNETGDNRVMVTRNVNGMQQRNELNLRDYLEASDSIAPFKVEQGDVVYVPKAPVFYIYGEVQHPGAYRIEPNITVLKAISIGGGLTLNGTENDVVIKRMNERGALQKIDVELSEPVLKDDVIYIDERWF